MLLALILIVVIGTGAITLLTLLAYVLGLFKKEGPREPVVDEKLSTLAEERNEGDIV